MLQGRDEWLTETKWPKSLKYLPSGLFQKAFADTWSRTPDSFLTECEGVGASSSRLVSANAFQARCQIF